MMRVVVRDAKRQRSWRARTSSFRCRMKWTAAPATRREAARPPNPLAGWVNDCDSDRDYKLNILRLHDDRQAGDPAYASALALAGYDAAGLYATAATDGTSVLCARCHASNALPGNRHAGLKPLTEALHAYHATVTDPATGQTPRCRDEPLRLLSLPPGLGDALPARGRWAMPWRPTARSRSSARTATAT